VVVAALAVAVAAIWVLSNRQLTRRYAVTPETLAVPSDSAAIARGQHLATAIGKCVDCHGDNLGGQQMSMGPVGNFTAINLTRGKGGVGSASDADLIRAIRHGVAADGRPLVFMPSRAFAGFSAPDLAALIAYLRSVPPVDNELPASSVGPIGRMIIARNPGRLMAAPALDHTAPLPAEIPPGPTAAYGGYLTVVGGCTSCHGPNLKGGLQEGPPGTPPSTDLTPSGKLASWTEADFQTALRQGLRPGGAVINPFMPWRLTKLMTDEEISAVWAYLRTL
jgi:mono/diheme cytochrome c family protein